MRKQYDVEFSAAQVGCRPGARRSRTVVGVITRIPLPAQAPQIPRRSMLAAQEKDQLEMPAATDREILPLTGLRAPGAPVAPATCVPVMAVPPDNSGGHGASTNVKY